MLSATGTFSVERWALGVGRSAFACAFTRVCGAPGGRALPFTLRRCRSLPPDSLPSLLCRVLLLLASPVAYRDRKSTRLNSSHVEISYAVFCLKKKKQKKDIIYNKKINKYKKNK